MKTLKMNKLTFILATLFTLSLASCGVDDLNVEPETELTFSYEEANTFYGGKKEEEDTDRD